MIRVLIADDHPIARAGLRSYLTEAEDIEVVGEADTGRKVLDFIVNNEVDVVLLDVKMPDLDGIRVLEEFKKRSFSDKKVKFLVISSYSEPHYVLSVLRAGASGYLLKTVGPKELIDSIKLVNMGQVILGKEVMDVLQMKEDLLEELTRREIEVLKLTAIGLSAKEIAKKLFISERTVQGHLASVYEKLGVGNKAKAIIKALKLGIISLSELTDLEE